MSSANRASMGDVVNAFEVAWVDTHFTAMVDHLVNGYLLNNTEIRGVMYGESSGC